VRFGIRLIARNKYWKQFVKKGEDRNYLPTDGGLTKWLIVDLRLPTVEDSV
jgi:hypothetical protein